MKALVTDSASTNDAPCLRVSKVAEMLDCSQSKVYSLIQEGHLQAIRLSGGKRGGTRVLSSSLNTFLREGGVIKTKDMTPADKVNAQRHRYRRSSSEWF